MKERAATRDVSTQSTLRCSRRSSSLTTAHLSAARAQHTRGTAPHTTAHGTELRRSTRPASIHSIPSSLPHPPSSHRVLASHKSTRGSTSTFQLHTRIHQPGSTRPCLLVIATERHFRQPPPPCALPPSSSLSDHVSQDTPLVPIAISLRCSSARRTEAAEGGTRPRRERSPPAPREQFHVYPGRFVREWEPWGDEVVGEDDDGEEWASRTEDSGDYCECEGEEDGQEGWYLEEEHGR